jgi:hypothetical protein
MRSSRDLQAQPVASQDAMPARVELKAQHLLLPGLHAWIRSLDGIGEGDRDAVLVHVAQPDEKVSMGIVRTIWPAMSEWGPESVIELNCS